MSPFTTQSFRSDNVMNTVTLPSERAPRNVPLSTGAIMETFKVTKGSLLF